MDELLLESLAGRVTSGAKSGQIHCFSSLNATNVAVVSTGNLRAISEESCVLPSFAFSGYCSLSIDCLIFAIGHIHRSDDLFKLKWPNFAYVFWLRPCPAHVALESMSKNNVTHFILILWFAVHGYPVSFGIPSGFLLDAICFAWNSTGPKLFSQIH